MTDRLRESLESIVSLVIPRVVDALAVWARWEYRVTGVSPGPPVLVSGSPVSASCPFGPLASITLWPGPDGAYAIPQPGTLVLLEFHEGNSAKPAICGLDPSGVPTLTTLGGGSPSNFISLAPLVSGELTKIAAAFSTFIPGSGGASFPQPYVSPGPVASTKVVSG